MKRKATQIGLGIAAGVIVGFAALMLPRGWGGTAILSVVLFYGIIAGFSEHWSKGWFWFLLFIFASLHTAFVLEILRPPREMHWVWWAAIWLLETFFITFAIVSQANRSRWRE